MRSRSPMARLDSLLASGPLATSMAAGIVVAMIISAVGTIRTGRWWFRACLILTALLWPLPDHPFQGPVVLKISYLHGIHLADLLSMVALTVAILPWHRMRPRGSADARTAADERPANGGRP